VFSQTSNHYPDTLAFVCARLSILTGR